METKDILEVLEEEHDEVRNLIEMAQEAAGPTRERLLAKIETEWIPHSLAEEKILYSKLSASANLDEGEGLEEILDESYRDHFEANAILKAMKTLDRDSEDWEAHLIDLKNVMEDHIEEEEDTLFPFARDLLTSRQLEGMTSHYLKTKSQYLQNYSDQNRMEPKDSPRSAAS